jgi:hypothetical protein
VVGAGGGKGGDAGTQTGGGGGGGGGASYAIDTATDVKELEPKHGKGVTGFVIFL